MPIPKMIHQIWIGPDQKPTEMIKSWIEAHPDWTHYLWDERGIDNELQWTPGVRKLYDRYMCDERYCGAANVVRVLILHQYGGVYIDADMWCKYPLDGAWFMDHGNWISQSPHEPTRTQNAAMGAHKDSALMGVYLERLEELGLKDGEIHPSWKCTGSVVLDGIRNAAPPDADLPLVIVPSPAFHPYTMSGRKNPGMANYSGHVYALHKFYSTHGRRMT